MDDSCLGYLGIALVVLFLVSLVIEYIIIPYWYIIIVIGAIACAVIWGPGIISKHKAKKRASVQNLLAEFPKKYGKDISSFLLLLNEMDKPSADFDKMVDTYLLHRVQLSEESKKLNDLAVKHGIAERVIDPDESDTHNA